MSSEEMADFEGRFRKQQATIHGWSYDPLERIAQGRTALEKAGFKVKVDITPPDDFPYCGIPRCEGSSTEKEEKLTALIQAGAITKNEVRKGVGLPEVSEPWGNEVAGSGQEQVLALLRTEMESFKSKGQIAAAAAILSVIRKVDPASKGFTIVAEKEVRIKGQSSE